MSGLLYLDQNYLSGIAKRKTIEREFPALRDRLTDLPRSRGCLFARWVAPAHVQTSLTPVLAQADRRLLPFAPRRHRPSPLLAAMELYQAEWCPHSAQVRQRLTELGASFVARQVPAERVDREEMRRRTGSDEIPALRLDDGTAVTGDADAMLAYLDEQFSERADAGAHRERSSAHAG